MVRCHDCGQPVPDDELLRKTVETGHSVGWSFRSGRTYHRKVNLCPECWQKRRVQSQLEACGITLLVFFVALAGFVLWLLVQTGTITFKK
jgi:hypothetical protein